MSSPYKGVLYALVAACLTACASTPRQTASAVQTVRPAYSLVFLIHGDANYVFHDTVGIAHYANEEALAKAHIVARTNPNAEVFIFHDKPLTRSFLFFKQHDGEFFYYRNGELVAEEAYWREGAARFAAHGALYEQYRYRSDAAVPGSLADEQGPVRMLLYFGHELPEVDGLHYDASYPDSTLTITDFAAALDAFRSPEILPDRLSRNQPFDLTVMSTCFNGSPHSVKALAQHTRYLIASPTNVHLTYYDVASFEHLEARLRDNNVGAFAQYAAQNIFAQLAKSVQTVVSVSLYDTRVVDSYMRSVHPAYQQSLLALSATPNPSLLHCDCAELAPFNSPSMSQGVQVWYRPAAFGRDAGKTTHSGWTCWKPVQ